MLLELSHTAHANRRVGSATFWPFLCLHGGAGDEDVIKPLCVYVTVCIIFFIVSVHFSFFRFFFFLKSRIDKSEEGSRYQHVLALCAFFFFLNKGDIRSTFLRKFVFDVCMFCFIFVPRLILKNFAVS